MKTIKVVTRYPEIARAAERQNIQLRSVFMKKKVLDNGLIRYSYPKIYLKNGKIPVSHGKVIPSPLRMRYAKTMASWWNDRIIINTVKSLGF